MQINQQGTIYDCFLALPFLPQNHYHRNLYFHSFCLSSEPLKGIGLNVYLSNSHHVGCSFTNRTDFQKEVKIMSTIKDPNIVRVLGVCTRDDPLSVIVEYMKFGDLHQFLVEHVAENTTPKKKHNKQQLRLGSDMLYSIDNCCTIRVKLLLIN